MQSFSVQHLHYHSSIYHIPLKSSFLAGWRIVADLLVFHIITFSDIWLSQPVFSRSLSILRWGIIWEATRARLGTQHLVIPGFIRWLNPYCLPLCILPVCVCLFCYALTAIEHFIDLPNVIPRPSFNKWFKIHHYVYTFRIGFPCILLNLAIRNFICCFIFSSFSVMKFSYHYVHFPITMCIWLLSSQMNETWMI